MNKKVLWAFFLGLILFSSCAQPLYKDMLIAKENTIREFPYMKLYTIDGGSFNYVGIDTINKQVYIIETKRLHPWRITLLKRY